jgi:hypothetical protein
MEEYNTFALKELTNSTIRPPPLLVSPSPTFVMFLCFVLAKDHYKSRMDCFGINPYGEVSKANYD